MLNDLVTRLKDILSDNNDNASSGEDDYKRAIAALLCEVAGADHNIDEREQSAKIHLLSQLINVDENEAKRLLTKTEVENESATSLFEYTDKLRQLSQEERFSLVKAMWVVAFADGELDPLEDMVIRKTAELLYVDHSLFIKAKLEAQANA
ncbi:hypothetical protein CS022_04780 [Veronia nyctiphanis]|uniref:Co-chaperone DjlA N-terminal domain-containing protein n=1 Tax=Veronia nyctiphanis TaxID=1278244 RepID=A0A4Q0YSZ9_9GAMM|nr:TerB family tellurite resistance protein [Veronia nyctiphanis]RXJ74362.1 hypothetical protein CS022_04780 [Veronia nyctiphanis]